MVAPVTTLRIVECGFQQLHLIGRFLLNALRHINRHLSITPLLGDSLTLHPHAPKDFIDLAISTLFIRNQEHGHRDKVNCLHIIAWLNQHCSSAYCQVKQELTNSNVKVRLLQHGKHLLVVSIQHGLRLSSAVGRNINARLKAAPLALGREDARLQTVGKPLSRGNRRGVKHPGHLLVALAIAFPVTV